MLLSFHINDSSFSLPQNVTRIKSLEKLLLYPEDYNIIDHRFQYQLLDKYKTFQTKLTSIYNTAQNSLLFLIEANNKWVCSLSISRRSCCIDTSPLGSSLLWFCWTFTLMASSFLLCFCSLLNVSILLLDTHSVLIPTSLSVLLVFHTLSLSLYSLCICSFL